MRLQRRLLTKINLTLQRAIKEAVAAETAEHSAHEIQKSSSPPNPKRLLPVHHNDVSKGESSREDEDVQVKLKRGKTKKQMTGKLSVQVVVASTNGQSAASRTPSAGAVRKEGTSQRSADLPSHWTFAVPQNEGFTQVRR